MTRAIQPTHQTSTTGGTVGGTGVGIHELHALARQLVHVRRLVILGAHEGHIGPSQVVDEVKNDIWFGSFNGQTDRHHYE